MRNTCCIILAKSAHNPFRPDSSNILSNEMSCSATKVVSSMSSPAWFAKIRTGNDCKSKLHLLMNNYVIYINYEVMIISETTYQGRTFTQNQSPG